MADEQDWPFEAVSSLWMKSSVLRVDPSLQVLSCTHHTRPFTFEPS